MRKKSFSFSNLISKDSCAFACVCWICVSVFLVIKSKINLVFFSMWNYLDSNLIVFNLQKNTIQLALNSKTVKVIHLVPEKVIQNQIVKKLTLINKVILLITFVLRFLLINVLKGRFLPFVKRTWLFEPPLKPTKCNHFLFHFFQNSHLKLGFG